MYQNYPKKIGMDSELYRRVCFIMRLITFLLLVTFMQVSASSSAQKVSLKHSSSSLKVIFKELKEQTGYNFLYTERLLQKAKPVNIEVYDKELDHTLRQLFANQPLIYEMDSKTIVIREKTSKEKKLETSNIDKLHIEVEQQPIWGRVVSDKGEVIAGATVRVKGTEISTSTDNEGLYEINEHGSGSVLIFSAIGFVSQEVAVQGKEEVSIILKEQLTDLEEVVVVGYGTQKAKEITGAVSTINASKFEDLPVVQASTILKGLGSGITSVQSNVPGGDAIIRIRGLGTINNNDPLWVVDGVPGATAVPEEIESITILKDASNQAIYGARAANGVILVTTKTGKRNQPVRVDFSVRGGFSRNVSSYELMNTKELGEWYFLAAKNQGIQNYSHPLYGGGDKPDIPEYIFPVRGQNVDHSLYDNQLMHQDGTDTYLITKANREGTDWLDHITRDARFQQSSLGITGGALNSRYGLFLNYTDEEGVLEHTSFERIGLRFNYSANIGKWVEVGTFSNIRQNTNKGEFSNNGIQTTMSEVYRMQPIIPVYDIAGNNAGTQVPGTGNSASPAFRLWSNRFDRNPTLTATGNVYINANYGGFTLKSLVGVNLSHSNTRDLRYNEVAKAERGLYDGLSESNSRSQQYNWTNSISYAKTINNHEIEGLLGTEIVGYKSNNFSASRNDFFFTDPNYMQLNVGERDISNSGNTSEWGLISQFARVNYNYKSKYLFQGIVRRDGSSRFGTENRYGVFPAFSAGWRISQEHFMVASSNWLTDLKLRMGWGETGNDQIGNYNSFSTFTSNPYSSYYPISGSDGSATSGFIASSIGNAATGWESSATSNIGLDLTIFNRLSLTLDIWTRKTSDMLYQRQIPAVRGSAKAPSINIGNMHNKGVDLELSYFGKTRNEKLIYDVSFNISHYKNKVTGLSDRVGEFLNGTGTRAQEGRAFPEFFGLIIDGVFQTQEEVNNHSPAFGNYNALGNWKYRDVNGDKVINDNDRTFIGSPHPDFTTGLSFNLRYDRFRLSTLLYASYGNKVYNQTLNYIDFSYWDGNKRKDVLYESWGSPYLTDNRDAKSAKVMFSDANSRRASTYFVENGSYLRLENLLIGYDLSSFIPFAKKTEVFVQGTNLFTWTKYSGLDPQVGRGGMAMGVDEGAWPTSRQFLIGLGITF